MRGDYFAAGVVLAVGAVLVVLALAVFDDGGRNYTEDDIMSYEDYKRIDGSILGTSGPLEVLTIDGVQMLHATGTGTGAVVYEDDTVRHIKINQADADIIIMCGQSNAAYVQADPETALAPEIGTGIYLGWEDRTPEGVNDDVSDCRFYDFIDSDGNLRIGDKGPSFTQAYYAATGHKVIWLPLGMSGRGIANWAEGGTAWNKDLELMELANSQMPSGYRILNTYLFWSQGETDYSTATGYDHYIRGWTEFHDAAPEAWDRSIDTWYLAMGRYSTCGWVNDAFEELAETLDDVKIGSSIADTFTVDNKLMHLDDLHYSQIGDNALAVSLARTCARDQGAELPRAPVYLQQTVVRCDVGDSVDLGGLVDGYDVDGRPVTLSTTWLASPDTSGPGIQKFNGTTQSDLVLEGTRQPLAVIYVGYIGFIDGLEFTMNADGGASVIGRSYELENVDIPAQVSGLDVTEVYNYALHFAPWREVVIPDTVTTLDVRSVQTTPIIRSLTIGDGLASAHVTAFSCTFIKDGVIITSDQWHADPTMLHGQWEWDGVRANVLYYQEGGE